MPSFFHYFKDPPSTPITAINKAPLTTIAENWETAEFQEPEKYFQQLESNDEASSSESETDSDSGSNNGSSSTSCSSMETDSTSDFDTTNEFSQVNL